MVDENEQADRPRTRRRRTASRPAGPPRAAADPGDPGSAPEPQQGQHEVQAVAGPDIPAQAPEATDQAEPAAPEAQEPEPVEPVAGTAEEAEDAEAPAADEPEAADEAVAAAPEAEPAQQPEAADEAEEPGTEDAVDPDPDPDPDPGRAPRAAIAVAFSAEPPPEPPPVPPVISEVPALALFRPPDSSPPQRSLPPGPAGGAEMATPDASEAPEQPDADLDGEADGDEEGADDAAPRRRRRRGGRRRRRGTESGGSDDAEAQPNGDEQPAEAVAQPTDGAPSPQDDTAEEAADDEQGARRRRRRRRRAGVAEEMEDLSTEDQAETVVRVREGRKSSDAITALRGSTRIEAKRQRRRDGREAGRRRPPILTEAEFLARRESVERTMCVRDKGGRTEIAVLEDGILVEHYVNRADSASMVGNVFLGKVQNVLPSMEAAFVDIGRGRNAVLYAGEVNWDAAGMEGQPKRIELALKPGDAVLVQVTKDPIGHKGARLTSQISLPGRFLVYVPEGSMTGISRKLPDTERARLKSILKDVVPDEAGVIVRTAAEGATEEQLTADVRRLTAQWAEITKKAKSASAPALLYGEPDLAIKVVRDIFNEDFTELKVQGEAAWQVLSEYVGWVAPDLAAKISRWSEPSDLYAAYRVDEQLAKALDRKVWLPSGGSLVIDRTEAMTVVDVNTGRFTGQGGTLEETVTRNNLEAAEEIVRQLRLRDIGGIVVIDFIDMVLESNRDLVLRRLVECLGRDRTKHQVAEVTSLGLVQMTRKRIGQGLLEAFSTPCEHCGGRGHVVSTELAEEPAESGGGRRGESRSGRRKRAPRLGGMQTGKTPPPPKFDEHGHIDHSGDDQPEDPEAADPAPADPEPADPAPVDPEPADPAPVAQPEPAGGQPVEPGPVAGGQTEAV